MQVPLIAAAAASSVFEDELGRRRFSSLYSVYSPAYIYLEEFISAVSVHDAKTLVTIAENDTFPISVTEGAKVTAEQVHLRILDSIVIPRK